MKTEAIDKAIQDQKDLLKDIMAIKVEGQPCADMLTVAKEEILESICSSINHLMRIRDEINYGKCST